MKRGVQHRNIYLAPATGMDRHWFARMFNVPEVHEMFGFAEPAGVQMAQRLAQGELSLGMVRLVEGRVRIGFVLLYPPTDITPFHELGYVISEPRHRNAFTAIHALDAMGWYAWEHLGIERLGGRTRHDNRQAEAVVRRMGYRAVSGMEHLGHAYNIYAQDHATWVARRDKLQASEAEHPTPGGAAFLFLDGTPCEPVVRHAVNT